MAPEFCDHRFSELSNSIVAQCASITDGAVRFRPRGWVSAEPSLNLILHLPREFETGCKMIRRAVAVMTQSGFLSFVSADQ
jgi:hypothetical protein